MYLHFIFVFVVHFAGRSWTRVLHDDIDSVSCNCKSSKHQIVSSREQLIQIRSSRQIRFNGQLIDSNYQIPREDMTSWQESPNSISWTCTCLVSLGLPGPPVGVHSLICIFIICTLHVLCIQHVHLHVYNACILYPIHVYVALESKHMLPSDQGSYHRFTAVVY